MSEINKSLTIPLAIWTKLPPRENITNICYISSLKRLITASDVGHMMSWKIIEGGRKMIPEFYFVGHRCKISHLVPVYGSDFVEMKYLVSFGSENEIAVWELTTGRNVEFLSSTPFQITNVYCQKVQSFKQEVLFCCQRSTEILVLNSISLTVICQLSCESAPDWFSTVIVVPNTKLKETVVLATTVSGVVCMWITDFRLGDDTESEAENSLSQSKQNIDSKKSDRSKSWVQIEMPLQSPIIEADQFVNIDQVEPIKMIYNPFCSALVVVLTPYRLKIFHAYNWDVLSHLDCHRHDYFVDVQFLQTDLLLLHCQSGQSLLYRLNDRASSTNEHFLAYSQDSIESIPTLMLTIQNKISGSEHKFTSVSNGNSCNDRYSILKFYQDNSVSILDVNSQGKIMSHEATNLYQTWEKVKDDSLNFADFLGETNKTVTSLLMMPELSMVAIGLENGRIYVSSMQYMLHGVFMKESPSNTEQSPPICLRGHQGPVLSLLHPASVLKLPDKIAHLQQQQSNSEFHSGSQSSCLQLLKLTPLLWSSGADCSIRVWDMIGSNDSSDDDESGQSQQPVLLASFHCYASPIHSLKLHHLPTRLLRQEDADEKLTDWDNPDIFCGFSQGFTAKMHKSVMGVDNKQYIKDIRHTINMCMNAYVVSISEDDTISLISLVRRKTVINTAAHYTGPVRSLGWQIHSGYLVVEAVDGSVYVWDLASGSLDRIEKGGSGRNMLEHCNMQTRIRSRHTDSAVSGSTFLRRHSLGYVVQSPSMTMSHDAASGMSHSSKSPPTSPTAADSHTRSFSPVAFSAVSSQRFLKVHFIRMTQQQYQFVPVISFDVDLIIESLDTTKHHLVSFYNTLKNMKNKDSCGPTDDSSLLFNKLPGDFKSLVTNIGNDNHQNQLKLFILKLLLLLANSQTPEMKLTNQLIDFEIPRFNWSIGDVNLKTGCITFDLSGIFRDVDQSNHIPYDPINLQKYLIQSVFTKKLISLSKTTNHRQTTRNKRVKMFYLNETKDVNDNLQSHAPIKSILTNHEDHRENYRAIPNQNQAFDELKYEMRRCMEKCVDSLNVTEYKKDDRDDMSFYNIEMSFSRIITLCLNESELISSNSYEFLCNFVAHIPEQHIQTYILIWRIFLYPALDITSNNLSNSLSVSGDSMNPLEIILDTVAKQPNHVLAAVQATMATDWMWWWVYEASGMEQHLPLATTLTSYLGKWSANQHANSTVAMKPFTSDTLLRLRVAGLLHLAAIGCYLDCEEPVSNGDINSNGHLGKGFHGVQRNLFNKMFALDSYFLARLTADFLCGLINRFDGNLANSRSFANLVRFAVKCIGNGFTSWEPYIDSGSIICALLSLSSLRMTVQGSQTMLESLCMAAADSLELIGMVRPLVLIMGCYREMLRDHNQPQGHMDNHATTAANSNKNSNQDNNSVASMFSSKLSMMRRFSSPVLSSLEQTHQHNSHQTHSHRNVVEISSASRLKGLIPLLNKIIEKHKAALNSVLSELVELFVFILRKTHQYQFDLYIELAQFVIFPAISICSSCGYVSVGGANGNLVLIDSKIGRFFNINAHKTQIKITKISEDGKYIVSYADKENMLKLWQISPSTSLFHLSNHSNNTYSNQNHPTNYNVKLISSIAIPQIHQMVSTAFLLTNSKFKRKQSTNTELQNFEYDSLSMTKYTENDSECVCIDFNCCPNNQQNLCLLDEGLTNERAVVILLNKMILKKIKF